MSGSAETKSETKQTPSFSSEVRERPRRSPARGGPAGILMQQAAGNRAVNHLLESGHSTVPATGALLQRKCKGCASSGGECSECREEHEVVLQRSPLPLIRLKTQEAKLAQNLNDTKLQKRVAAMRQQLRVLEVKGPDPIC